MPELPEVELARRDLIRWTVGREILTTTVADPSVVRSTISTNPADQLAGGAETLQDALTGRIVEGVSRVGKRLAVRFDGETSLLVHLGMSGKWVRRDRPTVRHGRLRLDVGDDDAVWFIDTRRFGCVVPVPSEGLDEALRSGLGPDALDEALDGPGLSARVQTRAAIKTALLDQTRLAGVGNIQAGEALWRARIRPDRPASSLSTAEWDALATAIPEQLRWTLDVEGQGEIVYVSEWGSRNPFAVYKRAGEPCPRCETSIERTVHSGRSSFWCPACQP